MTLVENITSMLSLPLNEEFFKPLLNIITGCRCIIDSRQYSRTQLVTTSITGKADREIFKKQRGKSMMEEKEAYSRVQER